MPTQETDHKKFSVAHFQKMMEEAAFWIKLLQMEEFVSEVYYDTGIAEGVFTIDGYTACIVVDDRYEPANKKYSYHRENWYEMRGNTVIKGYC